VSRVEPPAVSRVEPPAVSKVEPEIAPDPKVTEILDGLGEGCSALLPPIKTAGEFNDVARSYNMQKTGPVGRDYCNKMVWAPDRKRALYCGANHGAPHRLNDAWEYDLPSNTWVLLFAPDPSWDVNQAAIEEQEVKLADGKAAKYKVLCTKRGGPFDPCHTWWGLTYDPGMKAMLWMNSVSFMRGAALKKLGVDAKAKDLAPWPPLWAFYPYEKKWRRVITGTPRPGAMQGGSMEYVPELKGSVWYGSQWNWSGMWVYQHEANSWKDLKPNGKSRLYNEGKDFPPAEAITCYDSENKVLVAQRGKTTYHYDTATNLWSKVLEEPKDSDKAPSAHDTVSVFDYDPVGKECLLFNRGKPGSLWSHSVATKTWTKLAPKGPAPIGGRTIGYFDPARNVLVVNSGASVWVYRHKKPTR
jgi:hypothetical protein